MSAAPPGIRTVLRADFAASPQSWARITLVVFRLGAWTSEHRRRRLPLHLLYRVLDAVWIRAVVGAEIPPDVRAGPGLGLHHGGRGIVLATGTRLGSNVTLAHNVTFAVDGVDTTARATVGDRVFVGTGAVVVGPRTIGDDATVGAGAIVTKDVRPGVFVAGVPAVEVSEGPRFAHRGGHPSGGRRTADEA